MRRNEGDTVKDHYTPQIVIGIVSRWRRPTNRAICGLCKRFKTDECPFTSTPPAGFCEKFRINASTFEEAEQLLLHKDAKENGVKIQSN